nr:ABC transporter substrate-binding protein [Bradyrhizobium icense]
MRLLRSYAKTCGARGVSDPQRRSHAAFAFNTRRGKFVDPRLRRAFNFAFDFESVNRSIFYGQYTRVASYFQGTNLASSGLPEGRELEILSPLREQVPEDPLLESSQR